MHQRAQDDGAAVTVNIFCGDALSLLRVAPDASIDAVVTDPPYGLKFMGAHWDHGVPGVEIWRECLRVLTPGGHLLAFAGTRTQHRMAVAIEDAGFEIRDMIGWAYGQGFPKSLNLEGEHDGWGTALKPAWEPITVARKPLAEKTVSANMRVHRVGALNIDACRVSAEAGRPWRQPKGLGVSLSGSVDGSLRNEIEDRSHLGRWPANLAHDGSDEVLAAFPDAPGQLGPISTTAPSAKTSRVYGLMKREGEPSANSENRGEVGFKMRPGARRLDAGSAARFFYCAKATKAERGEGNNHPTVKPVALMRWLVRMVTPVGGVVLDPFAGSGTTGLAARAENCRAVLIEREAAYVAIAKRRLGLP